jgi:outer membrane protein
MLKFMYLNGLALLLIGLGAAESAGANDLLQLYRLALTRDPTLQAASAQRDAAIEARPQALAQLLPQLTASTSATRERETLEAASSPASQPAYGNARDYGLGLSQTLWSFESFYLLKEATRQVDGAEATLVSAKQVLVLRVAQAYFGILAAKDVVKTTRAQRESFQVLLEQARVRQQTGVGPHSDVAQAQSFYDATETSLIDAENALDDARLALAEIVGTRIDDVSALREDIPLDSPEPASADAWVSMAVHDNPAIQAAKLAIEAADYDISAQRGKALPSVSLGATDFRTLQDPLLGANQRVGTLGVAVTWPLFQGGAVASAMRQSRALYHQAEAQYELVVRATEANTRSAYRDVVTGIQRVSASQRAEQSAQGAVEASRRNVEFGTGTEFDLLNAQNNYSTALRTYNQTRYDYFGNLLILKLEAGHLGESDLAQIDALLVGSGP